MSSPTGFEGGEKAAGFGEGFFVFGGGIRIGDAYEKRTGRKQATVHLTPFDNF